jgi:hypothetical protein
MSISDLAFIHASIYVAAGLSSQRNQGFLTALGALNCVMGFIFIFLGK